MSKPIIVTGALGHIGSSLIRKLPSLRPGAPLILFDNLSSQRYCSLFELPADGNYRFVEGDILTADLDSLFSGAEAVVHLAAVTDAAGSFDRQKEVEDVNFEGVRRVADACVSNGVKLVFISTTSVYGGTEPYVDESCGELLPQSPYAKAKLCAEQYLLEEAAGRGLDFLIYRFGTICGVSPGMRFHTAVNRFCWQATVGQPLTVWSTALHQRRPYLDLRDAVNAILLALSRDVLGNTVQNVVTDNLTVFDITEAIRKAIPGLTIKLVDSKIMNEFSFDVGSPRIQAAGFRYEGSVTDAISSTLNLLSGIAKNA